MNSLLEKLDREVIKMPLELKFALCVSKNIVDLSFFPLRARSQGFNEVKYQLGGWIYCCGIVQHKYYLSLLLQQGRFQSRRQTLGKKSFLVAINHVKPLGLR